MNSDENYKWIDEHENVHFVTTYSPYFAEILTQIALKRYEPLKKACKNKDAVLVFRTEGFFWDKVRTVILTYNPATARKKMYGFETKMAEIKKELMQIREKVNSDSPHWRDETSIINRYNNLCAKLHIRSDLYEISLKKKDSKLSMNFKKNIYQVNREMEGFGKNIIITDHKEWSTEQIVKASIDRWQIEKSFRDSKNSFLIAVSPIRHWSDSKIRCHLFTCICAMTYMRMLEIDLEKAGHNITAESAIEIMSRLHSIIESKKGIKKPARYIENPNPVQSEILKALNIKI
jgi:transposase